MVKELYYLYPADINIAESFYIISVKICVRISRSVNEQFYFCDERFSENLWVSGLAGVGKLIFGK